MRMTKRMSRWGEGAVRLTRDLARLSEDAAQLSQDVSRWSGGYLHRAPRFLSGARRANVSRSERWLSALAGLGLAALAFRRRSLPGMTAGALGAALIERGLTGRCPLYRAMRLSSA